MKRLFDILISLAILLLLSPLWLFLALVISLESPGGPFYLQERIGLKGIPFKIYKFRSMRVGSDQQGLLTVGASDSRITKSGKLLRKYKLDEFPQLLNVLKGEMSLVGPRPEVAKYVKLYNSEQKKVLDIKPGITDWASLEYFEENELLAKSTNPDKTYIEEIMPAKLALNMKFIQNPGLSAYFRIIWATLRKIIS